MATGALVGTIGVFLVGLIVNFPGKPQDLGYSATEGCTHPPVLVVPIEWVCGKSVYFIRNNHREYVGSAKDIAPMPKPRPAPYQIDGH